MILKFSNESTLILKFSFGIELLMFKYTSDNFFFDVASQKIVFELIDQMEPLDSVQSCIF